MPLIGLKTLLLAWLLTFSTWSAADIQVTDAAGRSIHLEHPAERIISLAPHLTENVYALGAGSQLIGAVSFSDYPEEANQLPRVGRYNQFDFERILALQPDLILAWHSGNPRRQVQQLKRLGLNVFYSEARTFDDLAEELHKLGRLLGRVSEAQVAITELDNGINELKNQYQGLRPVEVFYQIWDRPLMTINGEHWISQMLDLCGGKNLFAESTQLTPRLDKESLLQANPEAIMGGSGEASDQEPEWLKAWRAYPQLRAVQKEQLFVVDSSLVTRPTLRSLEGARSICKSLDQVRQADQEASN